MSDQVVGNVGEGGEGAAPEVRYMGLTMKSWTQIVILGGLFALTFLVCLRRLWLKTNPISGDPNWSHAVCVPVIGIYYVYANRNALLKQKAKPSWLGLPVVFLGLLTFVWGIYPGQNDFAKDAGMIVTLFGLTAYLVGWQMMRVLWFPILFLFCALPWPPLIYSKVALPLQELAARVAVMVLQTTDVNAFFNGTKIFMEGTNGEVRTLNVAEACAGLRSLMTFVTIGGAMAFLSSRPLWQKGLMTLSAVPIAIFCNVMRVSGQGLLDHYWSRSWSEGFAHQFAGMVMLIPAFFLLLLIGWLLDKIFVEVVPVVVDDPAAANAHMAAKLKSQAKAAGTPVYLPVERSYQTTRRSRAKLTAKKAAIAADQAATAQAAAPSATVKEPTTAEVKP